MQAFLPGSLEWSRYFNIITNYKFIFPTLVYEQGRHYEKQYCHNACPRRLGQASLLILRMRMAKHVGSLFHEPTRTAGAAPGPPGPHEAASRKGGHGAYVSFRHACTQSSRTREIFFEEEKREILSRSAIAKPQMSRREGGGRRRRGRR